MASYHPPQPLPRTTKPLPSEDLDTDTEQALPMMHQEGQPPFGSGGNSQVQQGSSDKLGRSASQTNNNKMGEVEEQPSPTGMLGWLGFGLGVFSLACLGICFCSPYWFQTYPGSFNAFQNMGLWEVCFDNYMHHKDDSQEIYNGCWWVFDSSEKYWKLREWLLPPWFISVQVMMTLCLMIGVGTTVACSFNFLHIYPYYSHEINPASLLD